MAKLNTLTKSFLLLFLCQREESKFDDQLPWALLEQDILYNCQSYTIVFSWIQSSSGSFCECLGLKTKTMVWNTDCKGL